MNEFHQSKEKVLYALKKIEKRLRNSTFVILLKQEAIGNGFKAG